MKFSAVVRGVTGGEPVEIPNAKTALGADVIARARPLSQFEEEEVISSAMADARGGGSESPKLGDPLYDAAVMVHTVAIGYVDPDSKDDAPEPFFDGGAAQVRKAFGPDEIAYLYERQQAAQGAASPSIQRATPEQLWEITLAIAAGKRDDGRDPFISLSPALRVSWARISARQLVDLLEHKSTSGPLQAESMRQ